MPAAPGTVRRMAPDDAPPLAGIVLRPMALDDVDDVIGVIDAADAALALQGGREPEIRTDAHQRSFRAGMERFVARDPHGAWVAVEAGRVVGMAEAIRRGPFWGLSMLFVHPEQQERGIGRRLLEAALRYGEDATVRMIMASPDPRALRRYALAGLALHPAVEATGAIDRSAIPAGLPGRSGGHDDLDLVASVDEGLRGSRAEDVAAMLDDEGRMEVVDGPSGRGYVVHRRGHVLLLGATDEATASLLLWRFLAEAGERTDLWCLTAQQGWAVRVALAARLSVAPTGPLFIGGMAAPPGPWIPSGWYF